MSPAEAAAHLLQDSVDRVLLFGPVVRRPETNWYFIVVGCSRTGEVWNDLFGVGSEGATVKMREHLKVALVEKRPCVMIDFDDELEVAGYAEAIWPCQKITRIREQIEAERGARASS
jgi:hypothetical protein